MKIRLHEIELGSADVQKSTNFFQQLLDLKPAVQQNGLTVFQSGQQNLDFNLSNHLAQNTIAVSFLTDDLTAIEQRLKDAGIAYEGPSPSHLGMNCLQFKSPDGHIIKVNTATASSPAWLKV